MYLPGIGHPKKLMDRAVARGWVTRPAVEPPSPATTLPVEVLAAKRGLTVAALRAKNRAKQRRWLERRAREGNPNWWTEYYRKQRQQQKEALA